MDEQNRQWLKQWLKENLVLEVEQDDKSGPGNSVTVSLRFVDDRNTFSRAWIAIPAGGA